MLVEIFNCLTYISFISASYTYSINKYYIIENMFYLKNGINKNLNCKLCLYFRNNFYEIFFFAQMPKHLSIITFYFNVGDKILFDVQMYLYIYIYILGIFSSFVIICVPLRNCYQKQDPSVL